MTFFFEATRQSLRGHKILNSDVQMSHISFSKNEKRREKHIVGPWYYLIFTLRLELEQKCITKVHTHSLKNSLLIYY